MRKILLSLALLIGFASQALAADNYTATAGSGLTFGAKDNGSGVLFSRFIGCDNTTTTQCWAVDASGRITVNLAAASTIAVTQAASSVASGAYSAGSFAAGALAASSLASGAGVDGWDLTQGAKADALCTVPTSTTACSVVAILKALTNVANSATPAGTNTIGGVKLIDTAGTNVGTIKPASTAPVATDTSIVTALNPNSPGIITLGSATAANSIPMTVGPALLGSYCMGANSGTMAAGLAGGSPVFSFRYGAASLAIIRKVTAEADDITTAFVAGAAKFDMIAARSFTVSDTGGTSGTLTGNNGKLRTSFATTGISDFRVASTATLTAGTRTLDTQPLASVEFSVATSIDAGLLPTTDIFKVGIGESPLVLAQNEGFVLQATVPGTGTWVFSVRVCWDEVSAF